MTYGSTALAALADPTRQAIVRRLAAGPQPVGELAAHLPVSRPAVSQHLKVLKHAGLVRDDPRGTQRLYRLEPAGLEAVRDSIDSLWKQALTAFKTAVEEER